MCSVFAEERMDLTSNERSQQRPVASPLRRQRFQFSRPLYCATTLLVNVNVERATDLCRQFLLSRNWIRLMRSRRDWRTSSALVGWRFVHYHPESVDTVAFRSHVDFDSGMPLIGKMLTMTVGCVDRPITHHIAKFQRNRAMRCRVIDIRRFS